MIDAIKPSSFILFVIFCIVGVFAAVGTAISADYYIDAAGGNDSNSGSRNSPWKTLAKANATLSAGDTVYLKEGIYLNQQIRPANSGRQDRYITYQSDGSGEVVLRGHSLPICLNGNDYVHIRGIRIEDCHRFFALFNGADHNVIQDCTFFNAKGYYGGILSYYDVNPDKGYADKNVVASKGNNYNRFLNNIFEDAPDGCADGSDQDCDTRPADNLLCEFGSHNLFQGNTFGNTSHDGLVISRENSTHNVVRNNTFRNTFRRGLDMYKGARFILVEKNQFYDHGLNTDKSPRLGTRDTKPWKPGAMQCIKGVQNVIIRNNIFDNNGHVLSFSSERLYFYHNTANRQIMTIFGDGGDFDNKNNAYKNNIFANTASIGRPNDGQYVYSWITYVQPGHVIENNVIAHNTFTGNNDRFKYGGATYKSIDEFENGQSSVSNNLTIAPVFEKSADRQFLLASSSALVDRGTWLTTVKSASGGTTSLVVVDDARYFYDGWGIAGESGDWIKTQSGQETRIQSIDYSNHTLTVSPAIDIRQGEGIALKFYGAAPDLGAHETSALGQSSAPPAAVPPNVRIE